MANHRFDIHELSTHDGPVGYKAICLCRAASDTMRHRWEAEDWGRAHLVVVERVKAHLSRGAVSLLRARDYYRQMEADNSKPWAERELWKALADELEHRLNDQDPVDEGQMELFSMKPTERQKP